MDPLSVSIALCLLIVGLVFLLYLLALIFSPLAALFRGSGTSSRLKKADQKLEKVDQLISQQKLNDAIRHLRKAVMVEAVSDVNAVEFQKDHHQNILSRCLVIAEEMSSRPENIAEVERLFIQRAELQLLKIKATESYRSLRFRREKAGKQMPTWSKSDFEKRIVEIRSEIKKNETELEAALDRLFAALGSPHTESIIYH